MRSITNLFGDQTVKILLIYIWNMCILDVYDVMISYILLSLLAASVFFLGGGGTCMYCFPPSERLEIICFSSFAGT